MAGWHESGCVGEGRDHLLWWFADRRHDKAARNDVDLNKAAKWRFFCVGRVSQLRTRDGRLVAMAEGRRKEAVSFYLGRSTEELGRDGSLRSR